MHTLVNVLFAMCKAELRAVLTVSAVSGHVVVISQIGAPNIIPKKKQPEKHQRESLEKKEKRFWRLADGNFMTTVH